MFLKKLIAGACVALSAWGGGAHASADYPSKSITLVVPANAGGSTDVVARTLAEHLSRKLGQSVLVDNKAGASGMLGTQAVARAAPDGYTLLMAYSTPVFYAHHMFPKMAYDIQKDFAFITQLNTSALLLLVHTDLPVKNMKEFMSWAQANKGQLSYGSYGAGSAGHLLSAYLNDQHKLDMNHVPYKSESPLLQDIAAGVVPWGMGTQAGSQNLVKAGKLRPIAVLSPKRLKSLSHVPTLAEQGFSDPAYHPVAWFTLLAPAGTPKSILNKLETNSIAAMKSPELGRRLSALALEEAAGGAEQFREDFKRSDPIIKKLVAISGANSQ